MAIATRFGHRWEVRIIQHALARIVVARITLGAIIFAAARIGTGATAALEVSTRFFLTIREQNRGIVFRAYTGPRFAF